MKIVPRNMSFTCEFNFLKLLKETIYTVCGCEIRVKYALMTAVILEKIIQETKILFIVILVVTRVYTSVIQIF